MSFNGYYECNAEKQQKNFHGAWVARVMHLKVLRRNSYFTREFINR